MPKTVFTGAHRLLVETLKATRKEAGLTQAQVASEIGKDQSYISLIEGSQRRVDTLEFIALCRAMKANPVDVFRRVVAQVPDKIEV